MKNRSQVVPEFHPLPTPPPDPRPRLIAVALGVLLVALVVGGVAISLYSATNLPTGTPSSTAIRTPTLASSSTSTRAPTMTPMPTPTVTLSPPEQEATVISVINVNTIEVSINGARHLVYYIGLNAPPLADSCFEAGRQANLALVANQRVRLVRDVTEIDEIGRLPRYVYLEDRLINIELVRQGYARFIPYLPNIRFDVVFAAAEEEARVNGRGCYTVQSVGSFGNLLTPGAEDADLCGQYTACNEFGTRANFESYIRMCQAEMRLFDQGGDGIGCNQRIDWGYPPN
jgi:endonuclease YncB( thermonuclease family)